MTHLIIIKYLHAARLPARQCPPVRPALSLGRQTVYPSGAGLPVCGLEIVVEQAQVEGVGLGAPGFIVAEDSCL